MLTFLSNKFNSTVWELFPLIDMALVELVRKADLVLDWCFWEMVIIILHWQKDSSHNCGQHDYIDPWAKGFSVSFRQTTIYWLDICPEFIRFGLSRVACLNRHQIQYIFSCTQSSANRGKSHFPSCFSFYYSKIN
jgi:hypothetical protein